MYTHFHAWQPDFEIHKTMNELPSRCTGVETEMYMRCYMQSGSTCMPLELYPDLLLLAGTNASWPHHGIGWKPTRSSSGIKCGWGLGTWRVRPSTSNFHSHATHVSSHLSMHPSTAGLRSTSCHMAKATAMTSWRKWRLKRPPGQYSRCSPYCTPFKLKWILSKFWALTIRTHKASSQATSCWLVITRPNSPRLHICRTSRVPVRMARSLCE